MPITTDPTELVALREHLTEARAMLSDPDRDRFHERDVLDALVDALTVADAHLLDYADRLDEACALLRSTDGDPGDNVDEAIAAVRDVEGDLRLRYTLGEDLD